MKINSVTTFASVKSEAFLFEYLDHLLGFNDGNLGMSGYSQRVFQHFVFRWNFFTVGQ
jgi:hypothetical protein